MTDRENFLAWYESGTVQQYARAERWVAWQAALSAPPAQVQGSGPLLSMSQFATLEDYAKAKNAQPAQVQGDAVGYVNGDELDNLLNDRSAVIWGTKSGWCATPLYRHPPTAQAAPVAASPPTKWTYDPHDIGRGMVLNPAWLEFQKTTQQAAPVAASEPSDAQILYAVAGPDGKILEDTGENCLQIATSREELLDAVWYANDECETGDYRVVVYKPCAALAAALPVEQPFGKSLELRISQGWQLGGNACPILYTDTINGEQVCRDDLWIATTAGLKSAPPPSAAPVEPTAELKRLRAVIDEVHSWAVCGCIADAEDMAQNLPRIVEITTPSAPKGKGS
jgi:hypothetical protein